MARTSRLGVGVDFGTSNSVVATYDGKEVNLIPLENASHILPSAVYIDRQLKTQTGNSAIAAYIESNYGRKVDLVPEVVGRAELLVATDSDEMSRKAPETITVDSHSDAMIDIGLPGRLFRGVKRLLGDVDTDRLMVFERPFRLVALITPILLRIRTAVSHRKGLDCYVGRPVKFEGRSDQTNAIALQRLKEACSHAGLTVVADMPEPVAATIAYIDSRDRGNNTILTFDFGGGTLDLAIVSVDGSEQQVLATHGIGMGGDHIDQLLFEQLLFPLLGKGKMWKRRGVDRDIETQFPFERYEHFLLNWSMSYMLNQGHFRGPIADQIAVGGEVGRSFQRLDDLIVFNQCFEIFQALRLMKEELSNESAALLDLPQIDIELEVTRAWFDRLIDPFLLEVKDALDTVVAMADIDASAIDVVICTGGSSLIPAVQELIHGHFNAQIETYDPFASVARGLAIASYRGGHVAMENR